MIDIDAMIKKEIENGYGDTNAQAKVFTYNECVNKYGSKYLVMFVEPHRIWILISSDIL